MANVYLTSGQAAAAIGVHVHTLRRWANRGQVEPAYRTPAGHARWNLADLRRQLDTPQEQPVPEVQRADRPQYPTVATAIVTSRLGVLAGRRNDGKPPWTFIAGKIEPGESPADTITREIKEETGLLAKPGATIGERIHPATGKHLVYVAAVPATHNRDVFVGDEEELAEVRWLTLTEAEQLMPDMFAPVHEHLRRVLTGSRAKGQRKAS